MTFSKELMDSIAKLAADLQGKTKGNNYVVTDIFFDDQSYEPIKTIDCYFIKQNTPMIIWLNNDIPQMSDNTTKDILVPKVHPNVKTRPWGGCNYVMVSYDPPIPHPNYNGLIVRWAVNVDYTQNMVKPVSPDIKMTYTPNMFTANMIIQPMKPATHIVLDFEINPSGSTFP